MPSFTKQEQLPSYDIGVTDLELSQLVGFQIKVFSDQFPGKELPIKIVAATSRRLTAEGSHRNESVENLVNNQKVILQFPYRGQDISVKARLHRTNGGRCSFELDQNATPLSHRRFHRARLETEVHLAPFPSIGGLSRKLNRLRWMATTASNVSAGGSLVAVPTMLPNSVKLLINLRQDHFNFPALVLARVCHCYQYDEIQCRAGIEFVTREQVVRMFSPSQLTEMPATVMAYSKARREALNRVIREWDTTINCKSDTGVDDENE